MPENFVMPETCIGMTVLYYVDGDRSLTPVPATVTRVDDRSLHVYLNVTCTIHSCRGVRHVDDPQLLTHPQHKKYGTWDLTDLDKRQRERNRIMDEAGLGLTPAKVI